MEFHLFLLVVSFCSFSTNEIKCNWIPFLTLLYFLSDDLLKGTLISKRIYVNAKSSIIYFYIISQLKLGNMLNGQFSWQIQNKCYYVILYYITISKSDYNILKNRRKARRYLQNAQIIYYLSHILTRNSIHSAYFIRH